MFREKLAKRISGLNQRLLRNYTSGSVIGRDQKQAAIDPKRSLYFSDVIVLRNEGTKPIEISSFTQGSEKALQHELIPL